MRAVHTTTVIPGGLKFDSNFYLLKCVLPFDSLSIMNIVEKDPTFGLFSFGKNRRLFCQ